MKPLFILQMGLLSCASLGTLAQAAEIAGNWPSRPVHIVVPAPPGGGGDIVTRGLGEELARRIGQPVIIDNKAGAAGAIAALFVVKSAPDGYTYLLNQVGPGITAPLTQKSIQYNPARDFTHIVLIGQSPIGIFAAMSSPFHSLDDMVRYARANPGRLDYGSPGVALAGHLAAEVLQRVTNVQLNHIPYKGSASNAQGLLGGQVSVTFDTLPSNIPLVRSGKFRALAVTTEIRSSGLPEVPTTREGGYPGVLMSLWYGLSGPAGLPRPIVDAVNAAANAYVNSPDGGKRLDDLGLLSRRGSTTEEFTAFINEELAKLQPIIRAANIAAD